MNTHTPSTPTKSEWADYAVQALPCGNQSGKRLHTHPARERSSTVVSARSGSVDSSWPWPKIYFKKKSRLNLCARAHLHSENDSSNLSTRPSHARKTPPHTGCDHAAAGGDARNDRLVVCAWWATNGVTSSPPLKYRVLISLSSIKCISIDRD